MKLHIAWLLLAGTLAGPGTGWSATGTVPVASGYPAKPLRWIVSTSPGGGTDLTGRAYALRATEILGRPVVVDNRGGATGMIGLDVVSKAAPDGYTLVIMNVGHLMTSVLSRSVNFDPLRDFAPVALLARSPSAMVVHPAVNAKSLQEFVALARSQPGKINYASGGIGGVQHLLTEQFRREARVDLVHVPYKGSGPATLDLLAGQVQLGILSLPSTLPHIKAGRLRGLAVTGKARQPTAPDLPTFTEQGLPAVVGGIWYGMLAPARTPPAIVDKVAGAIAAIGSVPEFRARMSNAGVEAAESTPRTFADFYQAEAKRWSDLAREAGIRVD